MIAEPFGIKPDVLTCAKALSSGYLPVSAVLISEPVYRALADNADKYFRRGTVVRTSSWRTSDADMLRNIAR